MTTQETLRAKEMQQLRKDLEQPRPRGHEPFDYHSYNTFAHQAQRLMREFQAQADEAKRLYDLALEKCHAARNQAEYERNVQ